MTLGGIDYWLEGTTLNDMYFHPLSLETDKKVDILWSKLTKDQITEHKICKVGYGRTLWIPEYSGGVAWMKFSQLCEEAYSSTDYMSLAENIHTLVLTHVPIQTIQRRDLMRRFIWLADVLYDHHVRVYV